MDVFGSKVAIASFSSSISVIDGDCMEPIMFLEKLPAPMSQVKFMTENLIMAFPRNHDSIYIYDIRSIGHGLAANPYEEISFPFGSQQNMTCLHDHRQLMSVPRQAKGNQRLFADYQSFWLTAENDNGQDYDAIAAYGDTLGNVHIIKRDYIMSRIYNNNNTDDFESSPDSFTFCAHAEPVTSVNIKYFGDGKYGLLSSCGTRIFHDNDENDNDESENELSTAATDCNNTERSLKFWSLSERE